MSVHYDDLALVVTGEWSEEWSGRSPLSDGSKETITITIKIKRWQGSVESKEGASSRDFSSPCLLLSTIFLSRAFFISFCLSFFASTPKHTLVVTVNDGGTSACENSLTYDFPEIAYSFFKPGFSPSWALCQKYERKQSWPGVASWIETRRRIDGMKKNIYIYIQLQWGDFYVQESEMRSCFLYSSGLASLYTKLVC